MAEENMSAEQVSGRYVLVTAAQNDCGCLEANLWIEC